MTKIQILNSLLNDLAELTEQATSKEQALKMAKDKYLFIEYASNYGGYRLVNVGVSNGGHYGAFGGNGCEGRVNYKGMELKLRALINGIEYMIKK